MADKGEEPTSSNGLDEAMAATGPNTKRPKAEESLRRLVRSHRQRAAIAALAGVGWIGDLADMRLGRRCDQSR